MAITTVLFDLDGTLLPMNQDVFAKEYIQGLTKTAQPLGYEPMTMSSTILSGTVAMVRNSGSRTNEAAFWDTFVYVYGEESRKDIPMFEKYYETEYDALRQFCGYQAQAAELIKWLKDSGIQVILATNPLFPGVATASRIRWAGLEPSDFAYISTFENSRFCKPNPEYYRELIAKLHLTPANCLMVGNDVDEDMITTRLGMNAFLVTDCLINKNKQDIRQYLHGDFAAMVDHVKAACSQTDEPADKQFFRDR